MKTEKVVFLDIDGVLQPGTQYRHKHIQAGDLDQLYVELQEKHGIDYSQYDKYDVAATYWDWNLEAVALLKEILDETGAKIVVSSDWRRKDFFVELLKIHDLDKYYRGKTPYMSYSDYAWTSVLIETLEKMMGIDKVNRTGGAYYSDRCIEIAYYLQYNPDIINYVAIDDDTSLKPLGKHYIDAFPRMVRENRDLAIQMLNDEELYFDNIREQWLQRPPSKKSKKDDERSQWIKIL